MKTGLLLPALHIMNRYPEVIMPRRLGSQRKGAARHHTSQYPYIDLQSLFLVLIFVHLSSYRSLHTYLYSMAQPSSDIDKVLIGLRREVILVDGVVGTEGNR